MSKSPRMTIPTLLVLHVLLQQPEEELYGGEIGEAAGLPSGTVHPILARLEGVHWLTSRWEDVDPKEAGRPARRYYRLTTDGAAKAAQAIAEARRPQQRLSLLPVPGQS